MKAVYEGIEYFKCEVCNIAFSEEMKLISHIKDVHINKIHELQKAKCMDCGKEFTDKFFFKIIHKGIKTHK